MAWCFLINIYVPYVRIVSILMIVKLIFQVNIIDEPVLERFAWCHCWCFHWCTIIILEHKVSYCLWWCYKHPPRNRVTISRIKSWRKVTLTWICTSSHLLITTPRIDRISIQKSLFIMWWFLSIFDHYPSIGIEHEVSESDTCRIVY